MRRLFAVGSSLLVLALGFAGPASAGLGVGVPSLPQQQVLVKFQPGVDAGAVLRSVGGTQIGTVYDSDVAIVRAPAVSAEALSSVLDANPGVDYAEPDAILKLLVSNPNDPSFGAQYAMQKIQAVGGWTSYPGAYTSSGGPTIAMIDTGIDTTHADLAAKIDTANSTCFGTLTLCFLNGYEDDNGHGSHTSGTAAALTNNGIGVAGVAINAKVMAIKVCDLIGSCNLSAVASGINWARTHGAKVVSMSIGGTGGSTTLQTAVQQAWNAGMVLVASAGNDGNATLNFPAAYPQVISVAATDSNDARASFSNANADVEVAAPGVNVLSTYTGGGYTELSGTSMSAPHVSGLAALLFGQNPGWTNQQVRDRMNACSDDLGAPGRDPNFGFGRINLTRALSGTSC